jgi:AbrB family looped-hinge helix DNA binding protein
MRVTVSTTGQVTIPKPLRDRLGIRPGETLDIDLEGGRLVAARLRVPDPTDQAGGALLGCVETDAAMIELRGRPGAV